MKTIAVASHNPVKADAVLCGFRRMFPGEDFTVEGVSVPSGVSDQPMTDANTLKGAKTRAENLRNQLPDADFWVGIEGGCEPLAGDLAAFAWIVVLKENRIGYARTALFRLPPSVQALVEGGLELGEADDQVFGRENSKQLSGAVGLLTGDVVTRTTLYEQAVILALIPHKNQALYG